MKKIFLLSGIVLFFSSQVLQAQYVDNSLNLSQNIPGGTARAAAMAGAWGALGGDYYSVSQNPAGLGFYRKSELIFTPELYHNKTSSNYFDTRSNADAYNFNLNSFGYTFVSENEYSSGIKGLAFSVGYNKIANFNQNVDIDGTNLYAPFAEVALADIDAGIDDPFFANLFWDAYIIDYDSVNDAYFVDPGSYAFIPVQQSFKIKRSGQINEWNFALGLNYENKVYFGASLSLSSAEYTEDFTIREYDYEFHDKRTITGIGFSGKFGVIYKPVEPLRFGLTYHTPRYFNLDETYSSDLFVDEIGGYNPPYDFADYSYSNITPGKGIVSFAYVAPKYLLISTDLEYTNYSKMNLIEGDGGGSFDVENEDIENFFYSAINTKTGIELRNGPFRLRGGIAYIGSPFRKIDFNDVQNILSNDPNRSLDDTSHLLYTFGIGIRTENFFIDVAQVFQTYEELYNLYNDFANYRNEALVESSTSRTMLTLGFRF